MAFDRDKHKEFKELSPAHIRDKELYLEHLNKKFKGRNWFSQTFGSVRLDKKISDLDEQIKEDKSKYEQNEELQSKKAVLQVKQAEAFKEIRQRFLEDQEKYDAVHAKAMKTNLEKVENQEKLTNRRYDLQIEKLQREKARITRLKKRRDAFWNDGLPYRYLVPFVGTFFCYIYLAYKSPELINVASKHKVDRKIDKELDKKDRALDKLADEQIRVIGDTLTAMREDDKAVRMRYRADKLNARTQIAKDEQKLEVEKQRREEKAKDKDSKSARKLAWENRKNSIRSYKGPHDNFDVKDFLTACLANDDIMGKYTGGELSRLFRKAGNKLRVDLNIQSWSPEGNIQIVEKFVEDFKSHIEQYGKIKDIEVLKDLARNSFSKIKDQLVQKGNDYHNKLSVVSGVGTVTGGSAASAPPPPEYSAVPPENTPGATPAGGNSAGNTSNDLVSKSFDTICANILKEIKKQFKYIRGKDVTDEVLRSKFRSFIRGITNSSAEDSLAFDEKFQQEFTKNVLEEVEYLFSKQLQSAKLKSANNVKGFKPTLDSKVLGSAIISSCFKMGIANKYNSEVLSLAMNKKFELEDIKNNQFFIGAEKQKGSVEDIFKQVLSRDDLSHKDKAAQLKEFAMIMVPRIIANDVGSSGRHLLGCISTSIKDGMEQAGKASEMKLAFEYMLNSTDIQTQPVDKLLQYVLDVSIKVRDAVKDSLISGVNNPNKDNIKKIHVVDKISSVSLVEDEHISNIDLKSFLTEAIISTKHNTQSFYGKLSQEHKEKVVSGLVGAFVDTLDDDEKKDFKSKDTFKIISSVAADFAKNLDLLVDGQFEDDGKIKDVNNIVAKVKILNGIYSDDGTEWLRNNLMKDMKNIDSKTIAKQGIFDSSILNLANGSVDSFKQKISQIIANNILEKIEQSDILGDPATLGGIINEKILSKITITDEDFKRMVPDLDPDNNGVKKLSDAQLYLFAGEIITRVSEKLQDQLDVISKDDFVESEQIRIKADSLQKFIFEDCDVSDIDVSIIRYEEPKIIQDMKISVLQSVSKIAGYSENQKIAIIDNIFNDRKILSEAISLPVALEQIIVSLIKNMKEYSEHFTDGSDVDSLLLVWKVFPVHGIEEAHKGSQSHIKNLIETSLNKAEYNANFATTKSYFTQELYNESIDGIEASLKDKKQSSARTHVDKIIAGLIVNKIASTLHETSNQKLKDIETSVLRLLKDKAIVNQLDRVFPEGIELDQSDRGNLERALFDITKIVSQNIASSMAACISEYQKIVLKDKESNIGAAKRVASAIQDKIQDPVKLTEKEKLKKQIKEKLNKLNNVYSIDKNGYNKDKLNTLYNKIAESFVSNDRDFQAASDNKDALLQQVTNRAQKIKGELQSFAGKTLESQNTAAFADKFVATVAYASGSKIKESTLKSLIRKSIIADSAQLWQESDVKGLYQKGGSAGRVKLITEKLKDHIATNLSDLLKIDAKPTQNQIKQKIQEIISEKAVNDILIRIVEDRLPLINSSGDYQDQCLRALNALTEAFAKAVVGPMQKYIKLDEQGSFSDKKYEKKDLLSIATKVGGALNKSVSELSTKQMAYRVIAKEFIKDRTYQQLRESNFHTIIDKLVADKNFSKQIISSKNKQNVSDFITGLKKLYLHYNDDSNLMSKLGYAKKGSTTYAEIAVGELCFKYKLHHKNNASFLIDYVAKCIEKERDHAKLAQFIDDQFSQNIGSNYNINDVIELLAISVVESAFKGSILASISGLKNSAIFTDNNRDQMIGVVKKFIEDDKVLKAGLEKFIEGNLVGKKAGDTGHNKVSDKLNLKLVIDQLHNYYAFVISEGILQEKQKTSATPLLADEMLRKIETQVLNQGDQIKIEAAKKLIIEEVVGQFNGQPGWTDNNKNNRVVTQLVEDLFSHHKFANKFINLDDISGLTNEVSDLLVRVLTKKRVNADELQDSGVIPGIIRDQIVAYTHAQYDVLPSDAANRVQENVLAALQLADLNDSHENFMQNAASISSSIAQLLTNFMQKDSIILEDDVRVFADRIDENKDFIEMVGISMPRDKKQGFRYLSHIAKNIARNYANNLSQYRHVNFEEFTIFGKDGISIDGISSIKKNIIKPAAVSAFRDVVCEFIKNSISNINQRDELLKEIDDNIDIINGYRDFSDKARGDIARLVGSSLSQNASSDDNRAKTLLYDICTSLKLDMGPQPNQYTTHIASNKLPEYKFNSHLDANDGLLAYFVNDAQNPDWDRVVALNIQSAIEKTISDALKKLMPGVSIDENWLTGLVGDKGVYFEYIKGQVTNLVIPVDNKTQEEFIGQINQISRNIINDMLPKLELHKGDHGYSVPASSNLAAGINIPGITKAADTLSQIMLKKLYKNPEAEPDFDLSLQTAKCANEILKQILGGKADMSAPQGVKDELLEVILSIPSVIRYSDSTSLIRQVAGNLCHLYNLDNQELKGEYVNKLKAVTLPDKIWGSFTLDIMRQDHLMRELYLNGGLLDNYAKTLIDKLLPAIRDRVELEISLGRSLQIPEHIEKRLDDMQDNITNIFTDKVIDDVKGQFNGCFPKEIRDNQQIISQYIAKIAGSFYEVFYKDAISDIFAPAAAEKLPIIDAIKEVKAEQITKSMESHGVKAITPEEINKAKDEFIQAITNSDNLKKLEDENSNNANRKKIAKIAADIIFDDLDLVSQLINDNTRREFCSVFVSSMLGLHEDYVKVDLSNPLKSHLMAIEVAVICYESGTSSVAMQKVLKDVLGNPDTYVEKKETVQSVNSKGSDILNDVAEVILQTYGSYIKLSAVQARTLSSLVLNALDKPILKGFIEVSCGDEIGYYRDDVTFIAQAFIKQCGENIAHKIVNQREFPETLTIDQEAFLADLRSRGMQLLPHKELKRNLAKSLANSLKGLPPTEQEKEEKYESHGGSVSSLDEKAKLIADKFIDMVLIDSSYEINFDLLASNILQRIKELNTSVTEENIPKICFYAAINSDFNFKNSLAIEQFLVSEIERQISRVRIEEVDLSHGVDIAKIIQEKVNTDILKITEGLLDKQHGSGSGIIINSDDLDGVGMVLEDSSNVLVSRNDFVNGIIKEILENSDAILAFVKNTNDMSADNDNSLIDGIVNQHIQKAVNVFNGAYSKHADEFAVASNKRSKALDSINIIVTQCNDKTNSSNYPPLALAFATEEYFTNITNQLDSDIETLTRTPAPLSADDTTKLKDLLVLKSQLSKHILSYKEGQLAVAKLTEDVGLTEQGYANFFKLRFRQSVSPISSIGVGEASQKLRFVRQVYKDYDDQVRDIYDKIPVCLTELESKTLAKNIIDIMYASADKGDQKALDLNLILLQAGYLTFKGDDLPNYFPPDFADQLDFLSIVGTPDIELPDHMFLLDAEDKSNNSSALNIIQNHIAETCEVNLKNLFAFNSELSERSELNGDFANIKQHVLNALNNVGLKDMLGNVVNNKGIKISRKIPFLRHNIQELYKDIYKGISQKYLDDVLNCRVVEAVGYINIIDKIYKDKYSKEFQEAVSSNGVEEYNNNILTGWKECLGAMPPKQRSLADDIIYIYTNEFDSEILLQIANICKECELGSADVKKPYLRDNAKILAGFNDLAHLKYILKGHGVKPVDAQKILDVVKKYKSSRVERYVGEDFVSLLRNIGMPLSLINQVAKLQDELDLRDVYDKVLAQLSSDHSQKINVNNIIDSINETIQALAVGRNITALPKVIGEIKKFKNSIATWGAYSKEYPTEDLLDCLEFIFLESGIIHKNVAGNIIVPDECKDSIKLIFNWCANERNIDYGNLKNSIKKELLHGSGGIGNLLCLMTDAQYDKPGDKQRPEVPPGTSESLKKAQTKYLELRVDDFIDSNDGFKFSDREWLIETFSGYGVSFFNEVQKEFANRLKGNANLDYKQILQKSVSAVKQRGEYSDKKPAKGQDQQQQDVDLEVKVSAPPQEKALLQEKVRGLIKELPEEIKRSIFKIIQDENIYDSSSLILNLGVNQFLQSLAKSIKQDNHSFDIANVQNYVKVQVVVKSALKSKSLNPLGKRLLQLFKARGFKFVGDDLFLPDDIAQLDDNDFFGIGGDILQKNSSGAKQSSLPEDDDGDDDDDDDLPAPSFGNVTRDNDLEVKNYPHDDLSKMGLAIKRIDELDEKGLSISDIIVEMRRDLEQDHVCDLTKLASIEKNNAKIMWGGFIDAMQNLTEEQIEELNDLYSTSDQLFNIRFMQDKLMPLLQEDAKDRTFTRIKDLISKHVNVKSGPVHEEKLFSVVPGSGALQHSASLNFKESKITDGRVGAIIKVLRGGEKVKGVLIGRGLIILDNEEAKVISGVDELLEVYMKVNTVHSADINKQISLVQSDLWNKKFKELVAQGISVSQAVSEANTEAGIKEANLKIPLMKRGHDQSSDLTIGDALKKLAKSELGLRKKFYDKMFGAVKMTKEGRALIKGILDTNPDTLYEIKDTYTKGTYTICAAVPDQIDKLLDAIKRKNQSCGIIGGGANANKAVIQNSEFAVASLIISSWPKEANIPKELKQYKILRYTTKFEDVQKSFQKKTGLSFGGVHRDAANLLIDNLNKTNKEHFNKNSIISVNIIDIQKELIDFVYHNISEKDINKLNFDNGLSGFIISFKELLPDDKSNNSNLKLPLEVKKLGDLRTILNKLEDAIEEQEQSKYLKYVLDGNKGQYPQLSTSKDDVVEEVKMSNAHLEVEPKYTYEQAKIFFKTLGNISLDSIEITVHMTKEVDGATLANAIISGLQKSKHQLDINPQFQNAATAVLKRFIYEKNDNSVQIDGNSAGAHLVLGGVIRAIEGRRKEYAGAEQQKQAFIGAISQEYKRIEKEITEQKLPNQTVSEKVIGAISNVVSGSKPGDNTPAVTTAHQGRKEVPDAMKTKIREILQAGDESEEKTKAASDTVERGVKDIFDEEEVIGREMMLRLRGFDKNENIERISKAKPNAQSDYKKGTVLDKYMVDIAKKAIEESKDPSQGVQ